MVRRRTSRFLPETTKSVALTFDDGPDPRFTPVTLETLAQLEVTATFFLIGERAAQYPQLVRDIVQDGHTVGSHSLRHPEPGELGWGVVRDFVRGRREVERAAGQRVRLFRPPKGYVGRPEGWAMNAARVRPWLWTIDSLDWQPGIASEEIVANVEKMAAGDVVLLHDGIAGPLAPEALDRSATVRAIAPLVEMARSRDLAFVALPDD